MAGGSVGASVELKGTGGGAEVKEPREWCLVGRRRGEGRHSGDCGVVRERDVEIRRQSDGQERRKRRVERELTSLECEGDDADRRVGVDDAAAAFRGAGAAEYPFKDVWLRPLGRATAASRAADVGGQLTAAARHSNLLARAEVTASPLGLLRP